MQTWKPAMPSPQKRRLSLVGPVRAPARYWGCYGAGLGCRTGSGRGWIGGEGGIGGLQPSFAWREAGPIRQPSSGRMPGPLPEGAKP